MTREPETDGNGGEPEGPGTDPAHSLATAAMVLAPVALAGLVYVVLRALSG